MARFRFRCLSAQSRTALEAGVFVGETAIGFTPLEATAWLELHSETEGPQSWFATLWHHRVAQGTDSGGDFEILVDEHTLAVESRPSDFDSEEPPPPSPRG